MNGACGHVRVLDLSRGMTGNVATMILADFGADVVKVEPPGGDPWADHPAWAFWNRGKRRVTVDLKAPHGATHSSSSSPGPTCWSKHSGPG